MDTTQQILAVIGVVLMLVLVGPAAIRINAARGTTLRNIAIWVLAFVVLVFAYQLMHPAPGDGAPLPTSGPEREARPEGTPL